MAAEMTIRVVLIGDTHLPRFGRSLPGSLADALRGADLILHAGDHTDPFVMDLLEAFAPTEAVAGNNDPPELVERLGMTRIVTVGEVRIGLVHGHAGPGRTTPDRAMQAFADADPPVHAVAFGHSHQPMVERRDGTWLLNPGSPTDRRRQPYFSFMRFDVRGGVIQPELVRFGPGNVASSAPASVMHHRLPQISAGGTPVGESDSDTRVADQAPLEKHPDAPGGAPVEDELNEPTRESMDQLGRADLDDAPDRRAEEADDRQSPAGQNSDWLPQ